MSTSVMNYYSNKFYNFYFTIIIIVSCCIESSIQRIHGRYTRDIEVYELSVPHRVSASGELISFKLPQYFEHKFSERYKRDSPSEEHKLHYNVRFNGEDHHVELWPNHGFVSPNLVKEVYQPSVPVSRRQIKRIDDMLCHYIGRVRRHNNTGVALSLCEGLAGYLMTDKGQYFIEPVAGHQPNSNGEHVHVIYKRGVQGGGFGSPASPPTQCATHEKWADAWTRQLRRRYSQPRGRDAPKDDSSSLKSLHRYLETLIVVDKKFIDYHKNIDAETYIMTIMNMVSNFYHDSTAGNQLDVAVVRIMYLEKPDDHMDLIINQNAEVTLESFCNWSLSINPKDVQNPQHHDIAVLMTRYDLCSDNVTDCNLMGLAYVAAACDPAKSCAINEDNGLTLGITVSHEMGHVMGCSHDNNEDSECGPQTSEGDYYIMAPYVHMTTTKWSPCSRKFMTELFENHLGDCLNDEPQESIFQFNEMPPGSVYDADFQCNLDYPGSTKCTLEHIKMCETLYCSTGSQCSSRGEPPADGTKCGENMWCYNGKCVEIGQRPEAVDGGWGEWGEWSQCSRTCGGGVSVAERECNNPEPQNHGRYCIGDRKRVKICNTQECGENSKPFRDQQCSEYDSKPYQGAMHTWKPYFTDEDACKLVCVHEGFTYTELAPRVKDGTSCKRGTKNKCIFGVCRKVGCDWEIDSDAVEDQCGDCNGDGTHCKIIDKLYEDVGHGYQKIATIPAGSRNIRVNERKASQNTIAVSAEDGETYYLNGKNVEEQNGDYDFGGVRGLYDHPSPDKETLFIAGPLKKPIILYEVFYNAAENPGIEYKYSEPLPAGSVSSEKPEYHWDFLEFGDCSARCGPGVKTAKPSCVEKKQGKVAEKFCEKEKKPEPKTMDCNKRECKIKWKTNGWGKCSGCKFRSGVKTRSVDCVRESKESGKDDVITDDSNCTEPKPASKQLCCSNEPCPKRKRMINEFDEKIGRLWYQINRARYAHDNKEHFKKKRDKHDMNELADYVRHPNIAQKSVPLLKRHEQDRSRSKSYKDRKIIFPEWKRECENNSRFVKDRIPPEGVKLIEVPKKESNKDVNLSDAAFETEGDQVPDTLDFCHQKVFKGKQAEEELKNLKNNQSGGSK